MNTYTTTSFSFRRLGLLLRHDVMQNQKNYLILFVGVYAFFLFGYLFSMLIHSMEYKANFYAFCNAIMAMAFMAAGVWSSWSAAQIMKPIKQKEGRIAFLMLPASSAEKFIGRALIVTLGYGLLLAGAFLLAELSHFLFLPLFNLPDAFHQSTLPVLSERIFAVEIVTAVTPREIAFVHALFFFIGVFFCWNHSLFILGGSFWYRHPFLKTVAAIIAFNIAMGIVLPWFSNISIGLSDLERLSERDGLAFIYAAGTFFLLLTLFNWWLSYYFLKHSQLTKRKLL